MTLSNSRPSRFLCLLVLLLLLTVFARRSGATRPLRQTAGGGGGGRGGGRAGREAGRGAARHEAQVESAAVGPQQTNQRHQELTIRRPALLGSSLMPVDLFFFFFFSCASSFRL
ncbi:hypothetical protein TRIUR3_12375 [Triticum urartu]|uniref:Uncharacterized protein n=1 Tax=Triticum urartu TaxID=4572 RepID=M7ZB97_TRIUA|nr:hypothetical protein TRIUR3_12375 [Triticum urartu]